MESLFEPARKAIVEVVQTQRQAASYPITVRPPMTFMPVAPFDRR